MKKSIKRFRSTYLNRIIAFIILELFFISTVPIYANNTNNNKKDTKKVA